MVCLAMKNCEFQDDFPLGFSYVMNVDIVFEMDGDVGGWLGFCWRCKKPRL